MSDPVFLIKENPTMKVTVNTSKIFKPLIL